MSNNNHFISVYDSSMLYGIAILLMVFHHCFSIPAQLNYDYIPVLGGFELEARIAWQGKVCVALYAFISGYAFSVISEKNKENSFASRFKVDLFTSLRQLKKFYLKFWIVFLIFVPMGIIWFGKSAGIRDLLIGFFLGRGGYNPSWWYVWQYIMFLMVYPFLEAGIHYRKEKRTWIICITGILMIAGIQLFLGNSIAGKMSGIILEQFLTDYMIIFVTAFIIGKARVYERIADRIRHDLVWAVIVLVGCIAVRWFYVTAAGQSDIDVLLTPFLVFSLVTLFHKGKEKNAVKSSLHFWGEYSTFIWLTHAFWILYYFQKIVLLPRYSLLIYLWALLLSLLTSIALTWLQSLIVKFFSGRLRLPFTLRWR